MLNNFRFYGLLTIILKTAFIDTIASPKNDAFKTYIKNKMFDFEYNHKSGFDWSNDNFASISFVCRIDESIKK